MTITSPKDERFAAAVRGYRVQRQYPANEQNYDRIEDCGHEFERGVCIHCGTLEDFGSNDVEA